MNTKNVANENINFFKQYFLSPSTCYFFVFFSSLFVIDVVWPIIFTLSSIIIWSKQVYSHYKGPSLLWLYGSWIYKYLCNQCLSPIKLRVRISLMWGVLDTILCDKVCQWLATGQWFSQVSSTNKTDHLDTTKILLSGVEHHKSPPPFIKRIMYFT